MMDFPRGGASAAFIPLLSSIILDSRCNLVHGSIGSIIIDSPWWLPRSIRCGKVRWLFSLAQSSGKP
jgi:hypothetical protein